MLNLQRKTPPRAGMGRLRVNIRLDPFDVGILGDLRAASWAKDTARGNLAPTITGLLYHCHQFESVVLPKLGLYLDPKAPNGECVTVQLSLSPEDKADLKRLADASGLTMTEFVRRLIYVYADWLGEFEQANPEAKGSIEFDFDRPMPWRSPRLEYLKWHANDLAKKRERMALLFRHEGLEGAELEAAMTIWEAEHSEGGIHETTPDVDAGLPQGDPIAEEQARRAAELRHMVRQVALAVFVLVLIAGISVGAQCAWAWLLSGGLARLFVGPLPGK